MNKSIYEIAQEAIENKYGTPKPTTNVEKKAEETKKSPHLAICSSDNPSANNRHNSLMLKSTNDVGLVDLVKSEEVATEFDEFCKALTDPHVLLDLYMFAKNSGEHNFIQSLIDYNK